MSVRIRAGLLRDSVTIQAQSQTQNEVGEFENVWNNVATGVRAQVQPMSSGEGFSADQVQATTVYKVTIRYRTDITPKDRIFIEPAGPTLDIQPPVNVDNMNVKLEIIGIARD